MSRYHSYLHTAREILNAYDGATPFSIFSKQIFSKQKKYGSTDRREIAHLCYCYFRMGNMGASLPTEERILAGLFLFSSNPSNVLGALMNNWNEQTGLEFYKKLSLCNLAQEFNAVFPWSNHLSEGIDPELFRRSFFIQPDLFLRIRPGHEQTVYDKLTKAGLPYSQPAPQTISLPNASKADAILAINREVVVQDLNSQRVADFFGDIEWSGIRQVWDCCAASGGKSLMLLDDHPSVSLTVSDVRESILSNLAKRFAEAGITEYKSFKADLTGSSDRLPDQKYQLVIADVPCTGSGTWSRTPEQLFYFEERKMDKYISLQQQILATIIPFLDGNGYFLYITCSVFKQENEQAVSLLQEKFNLSLVRSELLKGYDRKADTLFAALLKRTS